MSVVGFGDRLLEAIDDKRSCVIVGLDPEFTKIPSAFHGSLARPTADPLRVAATSIWQFNRCIIDVLADKVPAVKPQVAFYEQYGSVGLRAFEKTVQYAQAKGLLVIEDAKRNDIGHTAAAYSRAHLGKVQIPPRGWVPVFDVDGLTVNPYLGADGITPFLSDINEYGKGIFVLVKTSNPSSGDLQDLIVRRSNKRVFEHVAAMVRELGSTCIGQRGYSAIGAVVGATYPQHAVRMRKAMPKSVFLVPGYGAQGARANDVRRFFNKDGYGALISASRSIIYPEGTHRKVTTLAFRTLVSRAIDSMNKDVNSMLRAEGLSPW